MLLIYNGKNINGICIICIKSSAIFNIKCRIQAAEGLAFFAMPC